MSKTKQDKQLLEDLQELKKHVDKWDIAGGEECIAEEDENGVVWIMTKKKVSL